MSTTIMLLDSCSFAFLLSALLMVTFRRHPLIDRPTQAVLITFVSILLFRDLSNILEHSRLVLGFGYFDDYVELLMPGAWGCVFYGLLQQVAKADLSLEIEQRFEAEQARQESERRYRLLVENQRDLLITFDPEWQITFVSPSYCKTFGKSEQEFLGREFLSLIHEDDRPRVTESLARLIRPPYTCEHEERALTVDGYRWFEWSDRALLDEEGNVAGAVASGRDITDRKQAEAERRRLEDQMQHAQKLESLGVLAGGIAHDFNNLLMAILGNVDLALLDLSPVSPARPCLQEIEAAARRAADLCRQMLAYSGKAPFQTQAVDLSEIVGEMGHILEVSVSKKARVEYHLTKDLPLVEADATQVRQVVMNLITNASEAIGDRDGVISLSTGVADCDEASFQGIWEAENVRSGCCVYLDVTDTGCGMDEETRQQIFDPFFTTKFTGRGLGLAAVLGIARAHKGAILIDSQLGEGTTFRFLLPASEEACRTAIPTADGPADWHGNGTVLLVDDEDFVRKVGERMLRRLGFEVLLAADGREAITLFEQHQDSIRCVVLDLSMPHMDGEETFGELQRLKQDTPILLCSGYSEVELSTRFAGRGFAGFIQKPYVSGDLSKALQRALSA